MCLLPRHGINWNRHRGTAALVVLGERLDAVPLTGNQTFHVPLGPGRRLVVHQLPATEVQMSQIRYAS